MATPALTRIDCSFHQGGSAPVYASFVSLNPLGRPGQFVAAGSTAERGSISSQVACRLALDRFVEGIVEAGGGSGDAEPGVAMLEAGFRSANAGVYRFGHNLAAGGRMSASLFGFVVVDDSVAVGRVGEGGAYLLRGGEIFPFFERRAAGLVPHEELVGAHSLVSVEVGAVRLQAEDVLALMVPALEPEDEVNIQHLMAHLDFADRNPCRTLCESLFTDPEAMTLAMLVRVGPEAIYLDRVAAIRG